jgi:thioredoxin-dependent peroxiredoxin
MSATLTRLVGRGNIIASEFNPDLRPKKPSLLEERMAQISFKGNPVNTAGSLPEVGTAAPEFKLTRGDLSEAKAADYGGKRLVLNIFPSIDTPVCATSVRKFNQEAASLKNAVVLCASKDLPFAQKRFCAAEGIENVVMGSEYKDDSFSAAYGVKIADGPLAGLFSRAIVIIDEAGKVVYTEQVPEITQEPDYAKALAALGT